MTFKLGYFSNKVKVGLSGPDILLPCGNDENEDDVAGDIGRAHCTGILSSSRCGSCWRMQLRTWVKFHEMFLNSIYFIERLLFANNSPMISWLSSSIMKLVQAKFKLCKVGSITDGSVGFDEEGVTMDERSVVKFTLLFFLINCSSSAFQVRHTSRHFFSCQNER